MTFDSRKRRKWEPIGYKLSKGSAAAGREGHRAGQGIRHGHRHGDTGTSVPQRHNAGAARGDEDAGEGSSGTKRGSGATEGEGPRGVGVSEQ